MQEEGEVIRGEPRGEDIDQMPHVIVLFLPSIRQEDLKGATSAESTSRWGGRGRGGRCSGEGGARNEGWVGVRQDAQNEREREGSVEVIWRV